MAKLSPLQRVKKEHGSKATLAAKVLAKLNKPEGEDDDTFANRIQTMSNAKLLRLFDAHARLEAKFGTRDALVDALVAARFPSGNAPYQAKLSTYSVPKLLDLARQDAVA